MFRLWAKVFKENKLLKDIVIENDSTELNRTRKVFDAIDSICYEFDLSKPQGKAVVTMINGRDAQYVEPLSNGDELQIYWRD